MKNIILFIVCLLMVCSSCQNEDTLMTSDMGYLRLEVGTLTSTETKAIPENYNPKQIAVQIVNAKGDIVKSTENWEEWKGKQLSLKKGTYTINASSNGFDGSESGFDIPYYAGSKQVTIDTNNEVLVDITCTLANVKVTVIFDDSFKRSFSSASTSIISRMSGVVSRKFKMGEEKGSAYFPVGDLTANLSVVNKKGDLNTDTKEITGVKARDHYILKYKVKEVGEGSVTVEADDVTRTYTFTFEVSTTPKTSVSVTNVNAWSNFAYVKGTASAPDGTPLEASKVVFEYKQEGAADWSSVAAVLDGKNYKATLTGLASGKQYACRMVYKDESKGASSPDKTFTTETQNKIPNLNFDDWYLTSGKKATYYPCKESDFGVKFWDSGNEGSNTIKSLNPTSKESGDVVKGNACKMSSTAVDATIMTVFAAGNIYTGDFIKAVVSLTNPGAQLSFGQPFTERPSQLIGYYKYNAGKIDWISDKVPSVKKGDNDQCSIYIALTDWKSPFAVNTQTSTFVDFTDESIIAYGELSADKTSVESMTDYEKFTINLKYRDLERKPTHILVVCSASKYGDYFVGSTSSVLLVDEFDFIYGEPTIDSNYVK
ncbi:DUF4493 domain-containing protein [Parabacteroides sp.]